MDYQMAVAVQRYWFAWQLDVIDGFGAIFDFKAEGLGN